MWTVVYMTQEEDIASNVSDLLEGKGLIVKIRPIGKKEEETKEVCFEILVPETEINEAHEIIIENNLI